MVLMTGCSVRLLRQECLRCNKLSPDSPPQQYLDPSTEQDR
ncbi:hypothetical protein NK6_5161 [Bradyrhizobium diazoefficiens]|uniref:Uncharacterized protein n=1 Tax=Bradyrhizobium diazoefficiens TaxID=1355477 RepID=A0A0E3VV05_9BRAD|nr:hypothetical protein NK6_5161 [Bradyrhizobium diazoefficiens]